MAVPKPTRCPALLWLACALLPLLAAWGARHGGGSPAGTDVSVPADWTMADLLRKLGPLGLRAVPANRSGPPPQFKPFGRPPGGEGPDLLDDGVYLTATGRGWDELSCLHQAGGPGEAGLSPWRGTVFVRASRARPDTGPLGGRRSALHAGRFHFYGDPDLLDRVEGLLRE